MNGYLKYSGMAFQMGVIISAFTYLGFRLDNHYKTTVPYFTAGFSLIGVGVSLYSIIKDFLKPDK